MQDHEEMSKRAATAAAAPASKESAASVETGQEGGEVPAGGGHPVQDVKLGHFQRPGRSAPGKSPGPGKSPSADDRPDVFGSSGVEAASAAGGPGGDSSRLLLRSLSAKGAEKRVGWADMVRRECKQVEAAVEERRRRRLAAEQRCRVRYQHTS